VGRACASGCPFGVGAMPRSRGRRAGARSGGTPPNFERLCFFVIALRAIAYTLAVGKREMISGRAELAKEEYATTWQEEVKEQPQAQRGGEPQVECGAQDEARARIAQDQRPQDGFPEGRRKTKREEDGAKREAEYRRP
jgi:hypothetical protein